jgi:hypothetical protein
MTKRDKVRWWQRFQLEVGVNWKMVPSRDLTWKTWAFDPFFNLTWPGKTPVTRADLPEGEIFGGLESVGEGKDLKFFSLVWWCGFGIRLLGLDVGVGLFYRTSASVAKLEGQLT